MHLNKDFKKQGKQNRQSGARFELKVRADLESKGWIVARWSNNVDFNFSKNYTKDTFPIEGNLIPAKSFMGRSRTNGFPDFIAFKEKIRKNEVRIGFDIVGENLYEIIGIEVKSNGYLTKEEKEKIKWLIDNNIFSKILIAKKGKKRGEIEYNDFQ